MRIYLFLIVIAALLIGCGNTELKWGNESGSTVQDIQWMSNSEEDQIWRGPCDNSQKTDLKEVTKLTGYGECLDSGGEASEIILAGGGKATTLSEGSANELTIASVKKKK